MKPKKDLQYPILTEIANRWSGRAYLDKALDKETVLQVLEAARWAPSSYNEQPWSFVVGLKGSENFNRIFETLMSANQDWAQNAGALILTVACNELERNGKTNKYSWYDLGQSVAYLNLEAEKLNLNVHQMGGFDNEKASENLGIKHPFEAVSVIAIGYRASADQLNEGLREKELSAQSRKSLKQITFFNSLKN